LPAAAESIKEVLGFAGAHRAPAEVGREEQGLVAYWRRHVEIVYGLHGMRDVQPSTGSDLAAPKLELRGVSKVFPGVRALTDVSLSIWPGETHMVLGENGAGKSTLMKVLCGAVSADSGEILYDGSPRRIASPADARELGIAVIFQEFSLVPHLDVAQNVFLGASPKGGFREPRIGPDFTPIRAGFSKQSVSTLIRGEVSIVSASHTNRWSRSPRRCRRMHASL
jgi:ABC-type multidrug transport system fused ATPase/permease subunit